MDAAGRLAARPRSTPRHPNAGRALPGHGEVGGINSLAAQDVLARSGETLPPLRSRDARRRAAECGIELHAPLSDADAARLFAEADLFLSPITSGTGIKIKTLDAMAHGKPMLGFSAAFRGVPVENGVQAMIAETPADFAR